MEVPDKLLGSEMKVLMNVRQHPASGQQDKQSFGRFKDGYDTKAAFYLLTFHNFSQRVPPVYIPLSNGKKVDQKLHSHVKVTP